jgi:hypothetical protein
MPELQNMKMKFALIISLLVTMFVGCKERSTNATVKEVKIDVADLAKPLIHYISINRIGERFGIELNGDQAFFRLETEVPERKKIPYCDGLRLLEGFYSISRIEAYRGKVSDDRQTSMQYLVNIYDEKPERYSKKWVNYVIPKNDVAANAELNAWFESMQAMKKQFNKP